MLSSTNGIETSLERKKRSRKQKHRSFRLAEMREHLSDVVNLAVYAGERVVLTRYGRPVVAVVPLEDMNWLDSQIRKRGSGNKRYQAG
jgi:prevent-host-death family protein